MRARCLLLIAALFILNSTQPTYAAGSKPTLNIVCGQITGGIDENGTYGLFKPSITVKYYGKPLNVTAYFYDSPSTPKSEAGQSIWDLTGSKTPTKYYVDRLDLERKILAYSQPQTGYYKIVFEAIDSAKRKSSFTCLYKDYYFSTPTKSSYSGGSSTGKSYSRGFDKYNCTFNGKKLYGSVYISQYSTFADFSVSVSNYSSFADLSVYKTNYSSFANSCGVWYVTPYSSFADFSIYITPYSSFADFSIYYTDYSSFAGTR